MAIYIEITPEAHSELKKELISCGVHEKHQFVPTSYFKNRKTKLYDYVTLYAVGALESLYGVTDAHVNILCFNSTKKHAQYSQIIDARPITTNVITVDTITHGNIVLPSELPYTVVFDKITGEIKQSSLIAEKLCFIPVIRPKIRYTYKDIIPLTSEEQVELESIIKYSIKEPYVRRCEAILWCQKHNEIQQNLLNLYNRIHNTLIYWIKITDDNIIESNNNGCMLINATPTNFIINNIGIICGGMICQ